MLRGQALHSRSLIYSREIRGCFQAGENGEEAHRKADIIPHSCRVCVCAQAQDIHEKEHREAALFSLWRRWISSCDGHCADSVQELFARAKDSFVDSIA